VFGIFAALAEFERELIRERTIAGLSSARARGRNGGRPYTMTPAKLRLAQAAMAKRDTKVVDLCVELGVFQARRRHRRFRAQLTGKETDVAQDWIDGGFSETIAGRVRAG
jgi:DNA invertase Pin-like site-specific DNA recombinase